MNGVWIYQKAINKGDYRGNILAPQFTWILGKILTNPKRAEETCKGSEEHPLCQEKSWDSCAEEATGVITTRTHPAAEARHFNLRWRHCWLMFMTLQR